MMNNPPLKPLIKKSKKGFTGYPMATAAFYGPTNKRASKIVIAIIEFENQEPVEIRKWFSEKDEDIRFNTKSCKEIIEFVRSYQVKSVGISDHIIGCPHEEGIDYPEDQHCPECIFWIGKNRWTGNEEKAFLNNIIN